MFNGIFTLECKLIMLLYDFSCLASLLYEYDSSKLYIMLDGTWKLMEQYVHTDRSKVDMKVRGQ
jgi:hypothetical protein